MDVMESLLTALAAIEPQHWLVLGLVLLIAEMASGTTYLLWPAAAAFVTALIAWFAPLSWVAELTLFAALVIVLTAFGRPLVQRWRAEGVASGLNERGQALIGARAVLAEFSNGVGAVKVGDTMWRAVSTEALAPGERVEIVGVDGATLSVKRAV
ncbi:MAG TPA: NfeD family protein [Hyphomonadaceae bacterium]|nr:NfeD family protein [Hyphomonadaceae bacterium]